MSGTYGVALHTPGICRPPPAACQEMAKAGLDGLLIFRQESMYWLTGYDTSGYSMF